MIIIIIIIIMLYAEVPQTFYLIGFCSVRKGYLAYFLIYVGMGQ